MSESVIFDAGGEPVVLDPEAVAAEARAVLALRPPASASWAATWGRLRMLVSQWDEMPPLGADARAGVVSEMKRRVEEIKARRAA